MLTRTGGYRSALALLLAGALAPGAARAADAGGVPFETPAWLYPLNPPAGAGAPEDPRRPLRVPGATVTFRRAELGDRYFAPDWRPGTHAPMPAIVARGRAPDVYACGYCHSPTGQGRPENAALAGLPAAYIVQQLADFRSGARRGAWHGPYLPSDLMVQTSLHVTGDEVAAAAGYFAAQQLRPRVRVIERATVPQMQVVGWVYAADPAAGREPLGARLLETAPDPGRHELRDDAMRYVVYAPPGSVARGRAVARSGSGATAACAGCHGPGLRGTGLVPPLAGRSPTYLLRQLAGFRTGTRAGPAGEPMRAVAATLDLGRMIDVAAYAASLSP